MSEKKISCENRVFVNRTINMNQVKLIGFDMDYTLVTYNVPAFEEAAYNIIKDKLINDYGYPPQIGMLEFDPNFIVRGLVIDSLRGDFLKVNQYGFARAASHGTKFYTFEQQKKMFGNKGIDLSDQRYYTIHTLFSLAEGCLYAQLVDYFDATGMKYDYHKIFKEVKKTLSDAHQEDTLKAKVIQNPKDYLFQDERIVESLKKFKRFSKKIALITNSDYEYSRKVMEYCFEPFLDTPWQDLFDLIIVAANKPDYFSGKQKYLRVDRKTGLLSNFFGHIEYNKIYQGGNAAILEKHLKLAPSEILYLGDHILGDIVSLKETIGWRTGLVVKELAQEVPALRKNLNFHKKIAQKMEQKEELENMLLELKEKFWDVSINDVPKEKKKWDTITQQIANLDVELRDLIVASQSEFNVYWGEVMRTGNEPSRFASLVERYACIYMSGIENLYYYSPFKYYRSQRKLMAHDPE